MSAVSAVDWHADIFDALRQHQVRLVSYVPDAGHARLIELCEGEPGMRAVALTSEEEGIGLACGAWLGGERSVLLMQSSGVGKCINALGMVNACRFPFLTLVTMRGEWGEFNPWQVPMGQATQATLESMGVIVQRVGELAEAGAMVEAATRLAYQSSVAVAVLLSQRMIGAKAFKR